MFCPALPQSPASPREQEVTEPTGGFGACGWSPGGQQVLCSKVKLNGGLAAVVSRWLGLRWPHNIPCSLQGCGAARYFPEGHRCPERKPSLEKLWTSKPVRRPSISLVNQFTWRSDRNQGILAWTVSVIETLVTPCLPCPPSDPVPP